MRVLQTLYLKETEIDTMEVLKTAVDWAKAEVFSTSFFILFGIGFVVASLCFWQLGKTDLARAYIIPLAVAGSLLLIIGVGLVYANVTRISSFPIEHAKDASAFLGSELARIEATIKEYNTIVFKVIPMMIIAAALLIVFINTPLWRAISITTIAMLVVILLIDGTAYARIQDYNEQLESVEQP